MFIENPTKYRIQKIKGGKFIVQTRTKLRPFRSYHVRSVPGHEDGPDLVVTFESLVEASKQVQYMKDQKNRLKPIKTFDV